MSNQEILDNAPEGWTHKDSTFYFRMLENNGFDVWNSLTKEWDCVADIDLLGHYLLRSRSDIEELVKLRKENAAKDKRIAELEAKLNSLVVDVSRTQTEPDNYDLGA